MMLLVAATTSLAWAGPLEWIDEKITEFIKDKSGVRVVEDKLRNTEQDLIRAREEIESMKAKVRMAEEEKQRAEVERADLMALLWKIPTGALILAILLVLMRLGFRKALQNRT